MSKFNKSVIYAIKHNNQPIYVGSTTNIRTRKNNHKYRYNNSNDSHYNYAIYKYIRELGGFDKITIEKIKDFNCNTKQELNREEGRIIQEYIGLGYNLKNKRIEGRTPKEYNNDYYKKNSNKINEYHKEYRKKNANKLKKHARTKIQCSICNLTLCRDSLSKHLKRKHIPNYINMDK